MKKKQITAVLMSMVLTVSACIPMNGINAFAASTETGEAATQSISMEAALASETESSVREQESENDSEPEGEQVKFGTIDAGQKGSTSSANSEGSTTTVGTEGGSASTTETNTAATEGSSAGATKDGPTVTTETNTVGTEDNSTATEGSSIGAVGDNPTVAEGSSTGATEDNSTASEGSSIATTEDGITGIAGESTTGTGDSTTTAAPAEEEESVEEDAAEIKREAKSLSNQDFDSAVDLTIGTEITGICDANDPYAVFRFTPSKTSCYKFRYHSDDAQYIVLNLYDSDHEIVVVDDMNDSISGGEWNAVLYEGNTYYYVINLSNQSEHGTITVCLDGGLKVTSQQESDIEVEPNEETNLSVEVYSLNDVSYEWTFYDNVNHQLTTIGSEAACTFTPISSGQAICTVNNGIDQATCSFNIYVNHFNAVGREQANVGNYILVPVGETLDLHVDVSGDDISEISYYWYKQTWDSREEKWINDYSFVSEDNSTISSDPVYGVVRYVGRATDKYANSRSIEFILSVANGFKAYVITQDSTEIDENLTSAEMHITFSVKTVKLRVGVTADDPEGISYSWYHGHGNAMGEHSDEIVAGNLYDGDTYYCTVTDQYGTSITCTFTIRIHRLSAYASSTNVSVSIGETSTIYINANSSDEIYYQWYYEDELLPGETSRELLIDETYLSGFYKCIVSTAYDSREIKVLVRIANYFYLSHVSGSKVIVERGDSATLEVRASGKDLTGITYQWYEVTGEGDEHQLISDAISPSYTVPSVTEYMVYSCKGTDRFNNSHEVYFYVGINTHLTAYAAGTTDDNCEIHIMPGETVRLQVTAIADDEAQFSYAWRDNGWLIEGEESDTYVFTPSQNTNVTSVISDQFGNEDKVQFKVVIENGLDASPEIYTTDGKKITPSISTKVSNDGTKIISVVSGVPEGQAVVLKSNPSFDTGTISVAWKESGSSAAVELEKYEFTTQEIEQYYSISCQLTDQFGNKINISFSLGPANLLSAYPEGLPSGDRINIYAKPGSEVTLTTVTTAYKMDRIRYKWYSEAIGNNNDWEQLEDTNESITFTATESRIYTCEVRDDYSKFIAIKFFVYIENSFVVYPEGAEVGCDYTSQDTYLKEAYLYPDPGEELDLKVNVIADDTEGLTFAWEDQNVYVANGCVGRLYRNLDGANGDTLHIIADKTMDYRCTVRNRYGERRTVAFHIKVGSLEAHPEGVPIVDGYANTYEAIECQPNGTRTLRTITSASQGAKLTYYWEKADYYNSVWLRVKNTTNELKVDLSQQYQYKCTVIDNYYNSTEVYFYVRFKDLSISTNYGEPRRIATTGEYYEIDVPVRFGQDITLEAVLDGAGAENASFSWDVRNGQYLTEFGELGNSITDTVDQKYSYTCLIRTQNGYFYHLAFHLIVDNQFQAKPAGEPDGTTNKTIITTPGSTVELSVEATALNTTDLGYLWYDSSGRSVYDNNNGTCAIRATENGFYTCCIRDHYGTEKWLTFRVLTSDQTLDDAQITLSQIEHSYTGRVIKPAVIVTIGGTELVNGKDYTVSYKNNINPGMATAVVDGRTILGSKTLTFLISKADQMPVTDSAAISVAVGKTATISVKNSHGALSIDDVNSSIATAVLNGEKITIKGIKVGTYTLTVKAAGSEGYNPGQTTATINVLPAKTASVTTENANKGIKVAWKKVTDATGYVIKRQAGSGEWKTIKTITSGSTLTYTDPNGNTNGTKYTYRVYAKAATGTSNLYVASVCYKVLRPTIKSATNSASKKMTVKWAKNAKANGYKLQYSLKSNFSGAKTVTLSKNTQVSREIGNLTKGKKYYVRLRSYKKDGSKYYYSTWSPTKTVTIKK